MPIKILVGENGNYREFPEVYPFTWKLKILPLDLVKSSEILILHVGFFDFKVRAVSPLPYFYPVL